MDVITFPESLKITSRLSILLHGVISLPDTTSCDDIEYGIVGVQLTGDIEASLLKHSLLYNIPDKK